MRKSTQHDYQERILKVLRHIQEHLDRETGVEELARLACFSQAHFHRFFKGMLGESLGEHIRRLRLERSALRLLITEQSVMDLALDAGYDTPEAFSRSFRRMFGASPSEYRRDARQRLVPDSPSGVHYLPDGKRPGLHIRPRSCTMNVEIKLMPSLRVAYMRHAGPYFTVGETWNALCAWACPQNLFGPATLFLGVCHDDPQITPPDKVRYDACMTVPEHIVAQGPVGIQEVFGGEWAVCRHLGPYEGLQELYNRLVGVWLPQSGRELRESPSVEIYRNTPNDTPPEKLVTDVCLALK
ncbi:MAG: GyrI-like domain-containing protein [Desulfovibrio sp.]